MEENYKYGGIWGEFPRSLDRKMFPLRAVEMKLFQFLEEAIAVEERQLERREF